ncbi:MAG: radical SAM protein [Myxococcales bacterium]|nr:radical SAM protein [Myxococcales bacterium]
MKQRVCFVNAPYDGPIAGIWNDVFPPLTILSLAAYVRRERPAIDVSIIDGLRIGPSKAMVEALASPARIFAVTYVSFNASTAYRFINSLKKARPEVIVIAGGTHVTSLENDAFEKSAVDWAAHGEAEETLVELLDLLDGGGDPAKILGLLYREDGRVARTPNRPLMEDINTLPFPARDMVNLRDYSGIYVAHHKHNQHILSGRGCVNNCWFCARTVWKRQKPWQRLRRPDNIVAELREMRDRYGVREYFDMGDEFNSSEKWATETATAIADANLGLDWQTFSRSTPVTDEMAAAMKASGCWLVHLGIESGNQATLNGIGKNITLEQARQAAAIYQRHGIKVVGLFMLFNAWEQDGQFMYEGVKESEQTLAFARSMLKEKLVDSITCSPAMPYPGGLLFDAAMRHSIIPKEKFDDWGIWDHAWNSVMTLPGITMAGKWRVKLKGIWIQSWSLIFSRHLNFSHAIWGRGLGMFKMVFGSMVDGFLKITGKKPSRHFGRYLASFED